jgi:IS30 family transposase
MSYKHISRDDRVALVALLRVGKNYREIGEGLGFHPTAISREVNANGGKKKYGVRTAQTRATTEAVRAATAKSFQNVPKEKRHTLTLDNGHEFTDWQFFEQDCGVMVYFAKPYHSWERGTSENANGLLRRPFPKGTLFATITDKQLAGKVSLINNRPRKRLGYKTPYEVFWETAVRTLIQEVLFAFLHSPCNNRSQTTRGKASGNGH